MATFIKNNCECCQPAVCESCDPCANTITTTKQFLAPGSEPQEGVILLPNTVTVQLADINLLPCGCDFPCFPTIACSSAECEPTYGFSLCDECALARAEILTTLYDPIVFSYYTNVPSSPFAQYEACPQGTCGSCVQAAPPDTIFVLGQYIGYQSSGAGVYIGNASYGVCEGYGQLFRSCGLIAETGNSLTYAGIINDPSYASPAYSGASCVNGRGGTATITW